MLQTVEAIIEEDGRLRLLETVDLAGARRVLVTFLDISAEEENVAETALLSEAALAEDWNRAEEENAWQHLQ